MRVRVKSMWRYSFPRDVPGACAYILSWLLDVWVLVFQDLQLLNCIRVCCSDCHSERKWKIRGPCHNITHTTPAPNATSCYSHFQNGCPKWQMANGVAQCQTA